MVKSHLLQNKKYAKPPREMDTKPPFMPWKPPKKSPTSTSTFRGTGVSHCRWLTSQVCSFRGPNACSLHFHGFLGDRGRKTRQRIREIGLLLQLACCEPFEPNPSKRCLEQSCFLIRKVKREKKTEFGCQFSLMGDLSLNSPIHGGIPPAVAPPNRPQLNRCGPRPAISACPVSWRCPEPNFRPEILSNHWEAWKHKHFNHPNLIPKPSVIHTIQVVNSINQQSIAMYNHNQSINHYLQ